MLRQLPMEYPSPDTALIFLNAFELALALSMVVVLCIILKRQYLGLHDLLLKLRKMARFNFQGGPYDVLIALLVLYMGLFIRAETVWEWRFMNFDLSVFRVSFGVVIKVVASF